MNLIYAYTYSNGDVAYLTRSGLLSENPVLARVFNTDKEVTVNLPDHADGGKFINEPATYPAALVMSALATTVELALCEKRPENQGDYA